MDKKKWKMIACHGRRNSSCASVAQQQIVLVSVHPKDRPEDLEAPICSL